MAEDKDRSVITEDGGDLGFYEADLSNAPLCNDSTFGQMLLPDERIIVTAQGRNGKNSLYIRIFTAVWLTMIIILIVSSLISGELDMLLFGIPHTLMGILLLFQAGFVRVNVIIAVSTKRLLIKYFGTTRTVYLRRGNRQGQASLAPADNDSLRNISFEGINGAVGPKRYDSSDGLKEVFELSCEDAEKIMHTIDLIIKGEDV